MAGASTTQNRAALRRRELLAATGVIILLQKRAFALPTGGRRLALKNAHTGETFSGPYRDATGPLPSAISDLAVFLRDFHADKSGPVDVDLLDFLTDVMTATNQKGGTVLSAYRTPETNESSEPRCSASPSRASTCWAAPSTSPSTAASPVQNRPR
jgi:uncharacterized protein YcbK (DUF882 family)